jgi:hypothetical protein
LGTHAFKTYDFTSDYFYKNSTFKFLTFASPCLSMRVFLFQQNMGNISILPRKFSELAAASVYCQALNEDASWLCPVYGESSFDVGHDGTIHYYRAMVDGSYVRAEYGGGDFLRVVMPDGEEVFFHYSQVFQPTRAAQKRIGTTAQVLAIAYQNANRQMAILSEFIREAEMLNADIERFRKVFNDFSAMGTNCDLAAPRMVVAVVPEQLTALEGLKMASPIRTLATSGLPQLYARVIRPDLWWKGYKWEFFFIDVDADGKLFENVIHVANVCYGRFEKPNDPPDYDLEAYAMDVAAIGKAFGDGVQSVAAEGSYALKTQYLERQLIGGFIPAVYYRCPFKDGGKITYEHLVGGRDSDAIDAVYEPFRRGVGERQRDVKPYFFGAVQKNLEQISKSGENSFITGEQVQGILGAVQAGIDYGGNRLNSVVTQVGAVNNEMQQSFAISTAAIEVIGEGKRRGLSNMR